MQPAKQLVHNFFCTPCMFFSSSFYGFVDCLNSCGFVCPEHSRKVQCCLCRGGRGSVCFHHKDETSKRCGAFLCEMCEYKFGCRCSGKSGK